MSQSDSSGLSSPPTSEDEAPPANAARLHGLDRYFQPALKETSKTPTSPPPPKRPASPPHEYVLADNADIAVIVMFRSRFHAVFPKSLPHYGPQDIERGVDGPYPGEHVERLLCALLGLVLNRKKDVERGHHQRALEEALQSHKSNWPAAWHGNNPLAGGGSFATMTAEQRLTLLRTLVVWALGSSDAVQNLVKESYKQVRHEDDRNQPLSVQAWGRDGYKRKYWLIEGQDDTHFRLYREANGVDPKAYQWFSVAGNIDEVRSVAERLDEEGTSHARTLRDRIRAAIPRFECGEEKRRRRDYRLARKAAFAKPEPGFSLYEGRTRGKRMRYTFDDEEDSDDLRVDEPTQQSGRATPLDQSGPLTTTSGRQVKSRLGGMYGENMLISQRNGLENEPTPASGDSVDGQGGAKSHGMSPFGAGAPRRRGRPRKIFSAPETSDESSRGKGHHSSSDEASGNQEWNGTDEEVEGVEEYEDYPATDEDEINMDANGNLAEKGHDAPEKEQESLVVQLRYRKGHESWSRSAERGVNGDDTAIADHARVGEPDPPPLLQDITPENKHHDTLPNGDIQSQILEIQTINPI